MGAAGTLTAAAVLLLAGDPGVLDYPGTEKVAYAGVAGVSRDGLLSPGGRWLYFAYDRADGAGTLAVLRDLTAGQDVVVDGPPAGGVDDLGGLVLTTAEPLVAEDVDDLTDVYRRDPSGGYTLVSGPLPQTPDDGESGEPTVSADGRYVAFTSTSRALVLDDPPPGPAVYLRDLRAGTTTLVSRGPDGAVLPSSSAATLSADGRRIAFHTLVQEEGRPARLEVRLRDLAGNSTVTLTQKAYPRRILLDRRGHTAVYDELDTESALPRTWVYDATTARSMPAAVDGAPGADRMAHAALSADGRYLGYTRKYEERHHPDPRGGFSTTVPRADAYLIDRREARFAPVLEPREGRRVDSTLVALGPGARLVLFSSRDGRPDAPGSLYLRTRDR